MGLVFLLNHYHHSLQISLCKIHMWSCSVQIVGLGWDLWNVMGRDDKEEGGVEVGRIKQLAQCFE